MQHRVAGGAARFWFSQVDGNGAFGVSRETPRGLRCRPFLVRHKHPGYGYFPRIPASEEPHGSEAKGRELRHYLYSISGGHISSDLRQIDGNAKSPPPCGYGCEYQPVALWKTLWISISVQVPFWLASAVGRPTSVTTCAGVPGPSSPFEASPTS